MSADDMRDSASVGEWALVLGIAFLFFLAACGLEVLFT